MPFLKKTNEYKEMDLNLDRVKNFLVQAKIGYDKLKYIHIAGTNGKGTTAKLLSDIFTSTGYKTGLYTSPHLVKINERIKVNSKDISDTDFKRIEKKYSYLLKKNKLTYFEYITAIAFIYFCEQKVDICILETGLGGRFDATNIVTPLVSIITTVALDHTEILGNTISKIAFEKAGIIKQNVPVVCGNMPKAALNKILKVAKEKSSKAYIFAEDFNCKNLKYDWKNFTQNVLYNGIKIKSEFVYSLLGQSQVYNLATVLCVCEILKNTFKNIKLSLIKKVVKSVKFEARFDIRKFKFNDKNITIIIDGAHNIQATDNFIKLYKQSPYGKSKCNLIFAIMQEKKYEDVVKRISSIAKKVYLIKPNNQRAVKEDILFKLFGKFVKKENIVKCKIKDCFKNIQDGETVFCTGSFFLAGDIIKFIEGKENV